MSVFNVSTSLQASLLYLCRSQHCPQSLQRLYLTVLPVLPTLIANFCFSFYFSIITTFCWRHFINLVSKTSNCIFFPHFSLISNSQLPVTIHLSFTSSNSWTISGLSAWLSSLSFLIEDITFLIDVWNLLELRWGQDCKKSPEDSVFWVSEGLPYLYCFGLINIKLMILFKLQAKIFMFSNIFYRRN